jgi:hypothetical protein
MANVKGWLEDDDPFFTIIDEIVESRSLHRLRAVRSAASSEVVPVL